jgi:uncharacterized lipoprotein YajG
MTKTRHIITNYLFVLGLITLLIACSTVPILRVTYRLPPQSPDLVNKEIYLRIEDNRSDKDMIGDGARDDFEHFTGLLVLYLSEREGERIKLGAYDIKSIFQEAFKNRLTRSGLKIVPETKTGQAGLVIKLDKFLLDLVVRKWKVSIDYEIVLVKQERTLFSQTMNGEGERLKVVGLEQANRVISELITDIINQPDLVEIFKKLE